MRATALLPILARFLEAARRVSKTRALTPIERRLELAMRKVFRAQGAALTRRLARLRGRFPIQEAISPADWLPLFDAAALETLRLFVDPIDLAVGAALKAGALAAIADTRAGMSFTLANPRAVTYLKQYGAKLVKGVDDTTRDYLRTIITQGVDEGWSYGKMAKAITDRYEEFAVGRPQQHIDSRAHLIAITESANGYEQGNRLVVQDLRDGGLEMVKSWLTVGDDLVSDGCQENQAEGWIPLDQAHSSGDQCPPRFPGCRCSELYQRKGAGR